MHIHQYSLQLSDLFRMFMSNGVITFIYASERSSNTIQDALSEHL
jgi:hypothetical protein